jgi:uncharacterized SAM-binding protein YcdF (DUF218 family)
MSWFITNSFATLLLPPFDLLLIGLAGWLLWHKRPKLSRTLIASALGSFWLLSTPYFAEYCLKSLEQRYAPLVLDAPPVADAIVVLGGGTYFHAPEYGGDTVSRETLLRLRYAAALYRRTGKPILVTGGKPRNNALSEAAQMKTVLEQEFHIPVRWVEDSSDNTMENARNSVAILQRGGISSIYLVTHAWHMPRAVHSFEATDIEIVPAPTAYTTRYRTDLLAFLPRTESLQDSKLFLHELIGMLWYKLKNGGTAPKHTMEKAT